MLCEEAAEPGGSIAGEGVARMKLTSSDVQLLVYQDRRKARLYQDEPLVVRI